MAAVGNTRCGRGRPLRDDRTGPNRGAVSIHRPTHLATRYLSDRHLGKLLCRHDYRGFRATVRRPRTGPIRCTLCDRRHRVTVCRCLVHTEFCGQHWRVDRRIHRGSDARPGCAQLGSDDRCGKDDHPTSRASSGRDERDWFRRNLACPGRIRASHLRRRHRGSLALGGAGRRGGGNSACPDSAGPQRPAHQFEELSTAQIVIHRESWMLREAVHTGMFWVIAASLAVSGMLSTALAFHQIALLGERGAHSVRGSGQLPSPNRDRDCCDVTRRSVHRPR